MTGWRGSRHDTSTAMWSVICLAGVAFGFAFGLFVGVMLG